MDAALVVSAAVCGLSWIISVMYVLCERPGQTYKNAARWRLWAYFLGWTLSATSLWLLARAIRKQFIPHLVEQVREAFPELPKPKKLDRGALSVVGTDDKGALSHPEK